MTDPGTRKPRVLYVIDSLSVGGAENSLLALAREYQGLGVDLHVAFLRPRTALAERLEAAGVTLHPITTKQGRMAWIRGLRRLINGLEPDLVHTSLFEGDIAGRVAVMFFDIPLVSSFVTDSYGPEHVSNPEYRRWKVRMAQLTDLITARRVDRFHSVSDNAATLMSRRLWIDRDRIDVVSRGRDPEDLGRRSDERRSATRERIELDPEVPMVVATARHYHVKGLDTLLRAFPSVLRTFPDAILFIAGREGPATESLRSIARESGIESNVIFAGYRNDVFDLLTAADVLVLPSRAEGSPGVLIEGMGLEVPIVASDIPSVREVAGSPPTVALVPLDDPHAFAETIVHLLGDREHSLEQAAAAYRRFITHYTMDQVARRMMGVYSRAVQSRSGGSRGRARNRFDELTSE